MTQTRENLDIIIDRMVKTIEVISFEEKDGGSQYEAGSGVSLGTISFDYLAKLRREWK